MNRRTLAPAALATMAAAALCASALPARAEDLSKAKAAVEQANQRLRDQLTRMGEARGAGWDKARTDARAEVATLLDFEALAEQSLGDHWKEVAADPGKRKAYVEAMRAMLEGSYLSRMQGKVALDDVQVSYAEKVEEQGGKPLVKSEVTKGQDKVSIDYVMAKDKSGKWRAVDVLTEGVSLAQTYRDQIVRLWPTKHYEGVVAAFQKKARQFDEEIKARHQEDGAGGSPASR